MKRQSGVLMHVSSLYGEYSVGSIGREAYEWIDFLVKCGFGVWQVLPFCLPDEYNSPYKSFGAFSLNPYFIDLPTLKEKGLITEEELKDARQVTHYSCEFNRLKKERMELLKKCALRVKDRGPIDEFLEKHKETAKFCEFMAKKEASGGISWNEWDEKIQPDAETLKMWQFTQYEFYREWMALKKYANSKGVSIVGDIPIYVSEDSSDVWANPELFQLDEKHNPKEVAGVPPDYFCEDGQLWGNPLYDWGKMKNDNYKWWQSRIKFMTELFDGVRIDHFRGIEAYFTINAGEKTARNGVWKKGPGMSLINAILPICRDKLIIAEDLGDITPEVHLLVKKSGFPGMRVLQFGFLGDSSSPHLPHNYCENCVAYTGTHDNNTLLGFMWEQNQNTKERILKYVGFEGDWNDSYDAILRAMFASHAGLLVLPVQDLLLYGSDTRLNVPGRGEGNWSYRITKEQLGKISQEKFRNWNELYGRK